MLNNYSYQSISSRFSIINNYPIDLGIVFRKARMENFMTQNEVADEIDVSVKLYQKYEYNICRPSLETVFRLFNLLGISANELQQKLRANSDPSVINKQFNYNTIEELVQYIVSNPKLVKIYEALIEINCPECLELITKINHQLSQLNRLELKRKLLILKNN